MVHTERLAWTEAVSMPFVGTGLLQLAPQGYPGPGRSRKTVGRVHGVYAGNEELLHKEGVVGR